MEKIRVAKFNTAAKAKPAYDHKSVFTIDPGGDECPYEMNVRDVNEAFAAVWPRREPWLLSVLREEMILLQEKYHSRDFSDIADPAAPSNFPACYEELMRGLNETTLAEIIRMDSNLVVECGGDFSGDNFVTQLRCDRNDFAPVPQAAILRQQSGGTFRPTLAVVSNG